MKRDRSTSRRLCGGISGRHADRDAAGAVHQQIRKACRQHHRLFLAAVVIAGKSTGAPSMSSSSSIAGRGCRAGIPCIASPPADRRRPSRNCPVRRSSGAWRSPAPCAPARHRSPCCCAGDISHHRRRPRAAHFTYFLSVMALLVHRVENAPVHRLEAVTRIERSRRIHAHRVIEIAALHLLGDGNRRTSEGGASPDSEVRCQPRWRPA